MKRLLLALSILFSPAMAAAEPPVPRHAATFTSAGDTLAFTGYGRGRDVIVLAGGPGLNAAYVAPLARTIGADGYRAVLFDQRGTGASVAAGRHRAMLTQRGTVADIEALRVTLHLDRITFVTHSFGGGMALAYAAAHPDHVAKLILIGSIGTDLSTVERFAAILMTRLSAAERARYAAAQRRNNAAEALDIQLVAEFDDRAKARATIAAEPHPFIYPAVSDAIFTDFARHYHVGSALRAAHPKVTLLSGADDAARAMEGSLRTAFPSATRVYVARSGHWPWIVNPATFDPALAAALRR